MLDFASVLYAHNLNYAERLVADLSDEQMTAQPLAGRSMNHAAFVIGHLAWVCDVGATLLGLPAAIDPSWKDLFSREALPQHDHKLYPPKAVLLKAYETAHQRLVTSALAASRETLTALPPERFRDRKSVV